MKLIISLLEKFNQWKKNFQWPKFKQWRQFFHISTRQEKYQFFAFAALAIIGLALLSWRSYQLATVVRPATGGQISLAIAGSPRFLNPVLSPANEVDKDLTAIIFSSLFKFDNQGKLVPDIAQQYAIGDNGKIYEITLKENIKWQDQKALTADDVIFTIQTIQNPDFRSPLRAFWQGIEIEKINDLAIRLKLKNPYSPLLNNLTFGILPKHLWENIPAAQFALNEMNLKPIGSGPYSFSKFQKDKKGNIKSLELKSFKGYFKGEAFISTLIFNFYQSEAEIYTAYKKDNIDVFSLASAKNFTDLKNKKDATISIYQLTLPRYFAVFFNQTQNKFLADKTIRQALAWGLNKKEIIEQAFGGFGNEVNSPLLKGMPGWSDQVKVYDFALEHAKNILAAAGWSDTDSDGFLEKDNQKLEINLTTIDWPELAQSAQLIKKQWEALGVKINLDIKETAKIQNDIIKPRQYQALLFGEIIGFEPDLFHFWHSTQKKESGLNLALYDNLEVDKLLSASIEDMDASSRAAKNQQVASLITEDLPAIFLFSPDYLFVAKKDIKGINLQNIDLPSSRFCQINEWYLKTSRGWK